jgi:predicted permease
VSLFRFFKRRWWDRERAREIEDYLEWETADNIARGLSPADAAAAARRKFGNPTIVREEIYRMNTVAWLESLWQDLRYGARSLRLSAGFAAVAILSLALGIGANTAIFQLLAAVRLRPLPVRNPQELAEIKIVGGNHGLGRNQEYGELTRPLWDLIHAKQQPFSGAFAWSLGHSYTGRGSQMRHFSELQVSGDFFPVLGVRPFLGRLLDAHDEAACPATTAVASFSYWQSELGGRDIASGIKIYADEQLVQIVGVAPPEFFGIAVGQNFDLAIPFCRPKQPLRRDIFEISVMGRLKHGWTLPRANSAIAALSPGLMAATAPPGREPAAEDAYKKFRLGVYAASTGVSSARDSYAKSLWLLLAITGLVLLIACANIANLLLARSTVREREIAVRLALGASRVRLLRQMLAESALLALTGAAIGIGLSQALCRALFWVILPPGEKIDIRILTDWRVLSYAAAAAILTCLVFGALPALRASSLQPVSAIKAGGRGMTTARPMFFLQRAMVVTQISVSLLLLIAALLFVRSFRNLMTFNPGIREHGVTVAFLGYWQSNFPPDRWMPFSRELLAEIQSTPGVLTAAIVTNVPLWGGSWTHNVRVGARALDSKFTWVSPDYFITMGIPILRGRAFSQDDTATSQRVALVNETFAHLLTPGADPIGQTLRTGAEPDYPSTVYQIIGVVPDSRYDDIRGATPPQTFAPAVQFPAQGPWTNIVVHSTVSPQVLMPELKRKLARSHPDVITEFNDFEQGILDRLLQERMMATLSGFFGALAAVLAMIGLYGVVSYMVTRRRNEIGIRLALGAARAQVVSMVMREAALLLLIGIPIGAALAILAGRGAGTLLFGLKSYDPLTFAIAAALLILIAAVSSFLPARRAAKLDPMAALRDE